MVAARLTAAALAVWLASSAPAAASCDDLMPAAPAPGAAKRGITALDLVRLRDVGYADALIMTGPSPLALSPDGRQVAFLLRRADPAANGYCHALVVAPLEGGRPRLVDRGGELITVTDAHRGLFVRGGFGAVVTPAWSPDGRWIAYLRRDHGVTQAWRVRADGSGAEPLTRSAVDIEALAWSRDGRRLIVASRPAKTQIAEAVDREGESGWLYDERVVTFSGPRPQTREADAPLVHSAIDVETGASAPASPDEAGRVAPIGVAGIYANPAATTRDGKRAWTERLNLSLSSPSRLHVADAQGRRITCEAATCRDGIIGLWWDATERTLRYLRREGWNREAMAFYAWQPGKGAPRRLYRTLDALIGCLPTGDRFVCTRENATTPRQVVLLDPAKGESRLIFDANPEFASIALGSVQRLRWRNDRGLEAWGDLVLPRHARRGERLPLVVVQYKSNGFLRGGTGDEYPIYLLAERGFAVLSFERPPSIAARLPNLNDPVSLNAAGERGWADRRSRLSAIETGVRLAIDRGIADPARVGITGLSDGSTTVRFAMINSKLFKAAAMSTCCLEPMTTMTYGGLAYADYMMKQGYPPLIRDDRQFWQPMSIRLNAMRIDVPLLMQLNDDDGHLLALEAFEALREAGKPVEMYVFPNEFHYKWQPRHRLAIYERGLDWFDFWLNGREDAAPAKAAQYERWRALRTRWRRAPSAPSESRQ